MKDLISRLEKATGPDRDIDLAIGHWLWRTTNAGKPWECFDYGTDGPNRKFTGSIDAARNLIPAGLFWHMAEGKTRPDEPLGAAAIIDPGSLEPIAEAEHALVEIALCIAALKAHLAMAEKG